MGTKNGEKKCNEIILLNGKISSSKADYLSKFLSFSLENTDYLPTSSMLEEKFAFFSAV